MTTIATTILHHFRDRYMGPFQTGTQPIPDSLRPGAWMHITDLHTFIETHLLRSQCACPLLQRLAIKNLTALYNHLPCHPDGARPL